MEVGLNYLWSHVIILNLFSCLAGYLCTSWGAGITGSAFTLGGEYSFSYNGIWCGCVVILALALRIVWGVGAAVVAIS